MNLATILRARQDLEPALEMYRQVVELRRMTELHDESELAKALGGTGVTLLDLGRVNEAEGSLRECLALRERIHAANHPSIMMARNTLGAVLVEQGRCAEAEPLLVSSWEVLRVSGATPQVQRDCLARLVRLYERWNRPEEAERYRALLP
jgi:tetratricopeptide (TPR) repeat protein